MGYAKLAVYLLGLIVVVAAVWIFFTQTPWGQTVPASIALVLILLLLGLGIMASARSINDRRSVSRVVREGRAGPAVAPPATRVYDTRYDATPAVVDEDTVVEERRYD
jgi:hypothetical protein